jgi:uncharacterized protein
LIRFAPTFCAASTGRKADAVNDIEKTLETYVAAWKSDDLSSMVQLYHDDFTLHYPGRHDLAGVHVGKIEALKVLREVGVRTRRKLVEIVDVMVGTRRGAVQVRERWFDERGSADVERVFVYTVREQQLHECWLFDADQEVIRRFIGRGNE